MSDKTFNFIRFLSEVGITAIGAFFKVIAEIWHLPYGEAILATCVALSTLIGVFTEWQRAQWKKNNASQIPDDVINEDAKEQINGI